MYQRIFYIILLSGICFAPAFSYGQDASQNVRPAEAGDFCIACGASHEHIDSVRMHKGRWVPICKKCDGTMVTEANFDQYFSKLQPKGALFQEDAITTEREVKPGWFLFGVWVAVALLAAALSAGIALKKGLPPVKWFFVGLAGSIFGVVYTMMQKSEGTQELPPNLGKIPTTTAPDKCASCGSYHHPSAKKCPECGIALNPQMASEASRAGLTNDEL